MKTTTQEETIYECEYCGATHFYSAWMENHEREHEKVEKLEIGEIVLYNFDSGNTRRGKVIKKDVANIRFLVEADNEERDWTSFYNVRSVVEDE